MRLVEPHDSWVDNHNRHIHTVALFIFFTVFLPAALASAALFETTQAWAGAMIGVGIAAGAYHLCVRRLQAYLAVKGQERREALSDLVAYGVITEKEAFGDSPKEKT